MPYYSYECEKCNQQREEIMSIAAMEDYEKNTEMTSPCCYHPSFRVLKPRRHVTFHADVYENIGHDPMYINSAQELQDACRKNDVKSNYMEDMGGLFGAKKNLWV